MEPVRTKTSLASNKEDGYTLLEVLIVVAIATVSLWVMPSFYLNVFPNYETRQFAKSFVSKARSLRQKSIATGQVERLLFNEEEQTLITIFADFNQLDGTNITLEPYGPSSIRNQLAFYPNGQSSGGLITIERGPIIENITVNWANGAIKIEDKP
jgi:prepilin-type N-terminal cleavage/methylation domain-containing protein